ncbi:MAG: hypothetical protein ACI4SG_07605 [Oligosphaeraceae bacterium]
MNRLPFFFLCFCLLLAGEGLLRGASPCVVVMTAPGPSAALRLKARRLVENALSAQGWRLLPDGDSEASPLRPWERFRDFRLRQSQVEGVVVVQLNQEEGAWVLAAECLWLGREGEDAWSRGQLYGLRLPENWSETTPLPGLGDQLQKRGEREPMVAMMGTFSLVPEMPLACYQNCNRQLAAALLGRDCRLRPRGEADDALRQMGVATLAELSPEQAGLLMEKLACTALVQAKVDAYRISRASQRRDRRRDSRAPKTILLAEMGGEIQVWIRNRPGLLRLPFHRLLTNQDARLMLEHDGEEGRQAWEAFGQEAMSLTLEESLRQFNLLAP